MRINLNVTVADGKGCEGCRYLRLNGWTGEPECNLFHESLAEPGQMPVKCRQCQEECKPK